LAFPDKLNYAH